LLLIAYAFPPEPVAGALRPGFLAKYLPEFGWEVTVLTRPIGHARTGDVVEAAVFGEDAERRLRGRLLSNGTSASLTSPSPLRRALRWGREALYFPDRNAGWIVPAIRRGIELTRARRFDAVLSTAMPATVHVAGAAVASFAKLPWIADYRDPWSGNAYVTRGPVRRALEEALERLLIRRADAVTTISEPIAATLRAFHRRAVAVIPNAADPAQFAGVAQARRERFGLCYTGTLYDGKRTPALLFEALAELRRERDPAADARVTFFGPNGDHVDELARAYGVDSLVERHGTVPRDEALAAQRNSSTLLAFLNMDEATASEMGSKIYEHAAARRPTIAFGPRASVVRDYVERHGLGWFASDLGEAKDALRRAYRRYAAGDGDLELAPGAIFHARDLARAFAERLESL
jgi:glycosyltransferase involved in cell wall biosynthesis